MYDFRKLNSVSTMDAYPMPCIDDLIDRVGQATFISTLDFTREYWQVPVAEDSQPKTAFTTPFGLYQFKVMPFGLQSAPACFQLMMDRLIDGLDESAAAYIDDLIIFSSSWSDHLLHVHQVLERLKAEGLTVKPKKCHFGNREYNYLGHCVGNGLVKPAQSKLDALEAVTTPTTKRQVRAFLGLAGYYRQLIPDF